VQLLRAHAHVLRKRPHGPDEREETVISQAVIKSRPSRELLALFRARSVAWATYESVYATEDR
jgi:hypothetical protein